MCDSPFFRSSKMKLTDLHGIGPKTEELFYRVGVKTPEDLIRHFPIHYECYDPPVPAASAAEGMKAAYLGRVTKPCVPVSYGKGKTAFIAELSDSTGQLRAIWYNAPYVRGIVRQNEKLVLRGEVVRARGTLTLQHPEIFTEEKYKTLVSRLVPVYSLTKGLSDKTVARAVREALGSLPDITSEYLPAQLISRCQLASEPWAYENIHFPEKESDYRRARERLAFDEAFLFLLLMRSVHRQAAESQRAVPLRRTWDTEELLSALPYKLTGAQRRVWREIEDDMTRPVPMQRLIQGDVGSGKTVLAFLAMTMCASNQYQSALMAPTEVLARQHYEKLVSLAEKGNLKNIHPVLLIGSMTAKEKRAARASLLNGSANAAVGTHALFSEGVDLPKLALVITDEQHRFGVMQRKALLDKGIAVHSFVMSATPIPRTLAVTFYGDFDLSVLDEKPQSRQSIKNAVVDESYYRSAIRFLKKEIKSGHQGYVICPMIEANEELHVRNVQDEVKNLKKFLPETSTGLLHGRMSSSDKMKVMEAFQRGEISLLVSTTVVEVGVDVPNATVMLVENAERFGLAQLHQLRGRVGRGPDQSYCIFMAGNKSEKTMERLKILQESNDGFEIAEKDLLLRGPGDPAGIRQSGELGFSLFDVTRDRDVLRAASEAARNVMKEGSEYSLSVNPPLRRKYAEYSESQEKNLIL